MTTTPADPQLSRDMPTRVGVDALADWLQADDRPRLIDVRSAAEYEAAHIPGSVNVPLPLLKEHTAELKDALDEQIVLVCRTDNRAGQAAEILSAAGLSQVHVLTGGTTAWQKADRPLTEGGGHWDIERQVRLLAGGIVASGILASTRIPAAKWVSGAIGAGLMTAALTDTCAMGAALRRLPYNRNVEPDLTTVRESLSERG